jgi:hypothetical protein
MKRYWAVGIIRLSKKEIQEYIKDGVRLDIRTLGMLIVDNGITPEEIHAAVERCEVYGTTVSSTAVIQALDALK